MVTFFIMNTNQQPNKKNLAVPLTLILQSRPMTTTESNQYQYWLDRKNLEWDSKY